MKTIAIVTAVAALLLVPVTLFAAFRPVPTLERIIYVPMDMPMAGTKSCAATTLWIVGDVR